MNRHSGPARTVLEVRGSRASDPGRRAPLRDSCPLCLGAGWLIVDEAGDRTRDWVSPCTCTPAMTAVEAADTAAAVTGRQLAYAPPASSGEPYPYLARTA